MSDMFGNVYGNQNTGNVVPQGMPRGVKSQSYGTTEPFVTFGATPGNDEILLSSPYTTQTNPTEPRTNVRGLVRLAIKRDPSGSTLNPSTVAYLTNPPQHERDFVFA